MRKLLTFFSLSLLAAPHGWANSPGLHVETYSAKTANVNSFVFFDSVGSLIVDATRSSQEALEVAKIARNHGSEPRVIFITHGHPDHYLGLGALKRAFPTAKIFVASQNIKDDIISFTRLMEQNHWLEEEPLMKARSAENPNGFDYSSEIQVLPGNSLALPAGERLEVISHFSPTEAPHETLLFSQELQALFASDLVYSNVHLWLGRGVDARAAENWRKELEILKNQYARLKIAIYPGHGEQTDSGVFETDLKYLKTFFVIVKTSGTQEEAKAAMIKKYPTWKNADFILAQSIKNQFALSKK